MSWIRAVLWASVLVALGMTAYAWSVPRVPGAWAAMLLLWIGVLWVIGLCRPELGMFGAVLSRAPSGGRGVVLLCPVTSAKDMTLLLQVLAEERACALVCVGVETVRTHASLVRQSLAAGHGLGLDLATVLKPGQRTARRVEAALHDARGEFEGVGAALDFVCVPPPPVGPGVFIGSERAGMLLVSARRSLRSRIRHGDVLMTQARDEESLRRALRVIRERGLETTRIEPWLA